MGNKKFPGESDVKTELEDWGGFLGSRLVSDWEIGKDKEHQAEEIVCAKALKWESMTETMSRWQKGENGVYEMRVRDYAREVSRDVSHSENRRL